MSKHTPGPWHAVGAWVETEDDDTPDICSCDPETIGQEGRSYEEICANAHIIAAAPELIDALRSTLKWLRECEEETGKPIGIGYRGNMQKPVVVQKIKDAIQKANGGFL